jgi:hypothetical protein
MASPFNPYQAPAADPLPTLGAGDFDLGRTVQDGFERTKLYWGPAIGVLLLGGLMMILSAITVIGYFLAVPVFAWGMIKFFLNMQDQRNPNLNDLFAGFSNYWTALGRTLLVTVAYIGLALLSESLVFVGQYLKSTPLTVVGYVIYVLFFGLVLSRFYFALFFVVDRDMPAMAAMSASWRTTQGKALKMVALALVAGLVAMSGVIGLLVGVLFTLPMSYVMYASAYRQVAGYGSPPSGGWGG